MKSEVIFNSDLHFEHEQWRNELLFWEDELKSFNIRLSELVLKWTDHKMLSQLEQFQNKFIRHGDVINSLQEFIHSHEINMAEHFKKGEDVLDNIFVQKHMEYRGQLEIQRHLYADLKHEFYQFLAKHM